MKKLLSLLSVLTISGTAIPTTIAASPYQKEEIKLENNEINYSQTNNLENLNRIKRNEPLPSFLNLSVPKIKQLSAYWCGPAIGESILRYFGLNTDRTLNNVNINHQRTYTSFQHYLAYLMETITNQNLNPDLTSTNSRYTYLGTFVNNWTNQVNNFISSKYLNNNRQYSVTRVNRNHNIGNIVSIIRNSLQNNTPVALAYRGYLPEFFSENSDQIENHFIIIRGIRGVVSPSGTNLIIDYMDPGTGQYGSFSGLVLRLLISNSDNFGRALESFLVSYIPSNISTEYQIPSPNQTESMDFSGNNIGSIYSYFESCNSLLNNNRYIRSHLNNNQYCKNSTIYGNKINIFKILNKNRGNLNSGDAFIGTSNGFYVLTKENNVLKKIDSVNGNIININLRTNALTVTNQNGTVYQVDYNKSGSSNNVYWLAGPAPTGWSFN